jgi:hypothetical protein
MVRSCLCDDKQTLHTRDGPGSRNPRCAASLQNKTYWESTSLSDRLQTFLDKVQPRITFIVKHVFFPEIEVRRDIGSLSRTTQHRLGHEQISDDVFVKQIKCK